MSVWTGCIWWWKCRNSATIWECMRVRSMHCCICVAYWWDYGSHIHRHHGHRLPSVILCQRRGSQRVRWWRICPCDKTSIIRIQPIAGWFNRNGQCWSWTRGEILVFVCRLIIPLNSPITRTPPVTVNAWHWFQLRSAFLPKNEERQKANNSCTDDTANNTSSDSSDVWFFTITIITRWCTPSVVLSDIILPYTVLCISFTKLSKK